MRSSTIPLFRSHLSCPWGRAVLHRPQMQVTYTLTRDQFIAANRQITAKRMRLSQAIAFLMIIAVAAVFSKDLPMEKASVFIGIAMVAAALGLFFAGPRSVSKRYGAIYDQVEGLQSPMTLDFDPAGIWVETVNGRHYFEFEKLNRIQETRSFFFLFASQTSAQIVPKSELPQEIQDSLRR